jgi:TolA-binding protein
VAKGFGPFLFVALFMAATAFAAKRPPAPPGELGVKLLGHAREQIAAKRYREAIGDLRDFVNRFPDHPYSDYAHYWLALAHLRRQEYALAEVTSDFLLFRHPASFKYDDAQLLNAIARWHRGQKTAADEIKKLLEQHPKAELAEVAEQTLFHRHP